MALIIAKKSYRTSILVIIGLMMCLLSAVIIQPVEVFGEPGNIFVEDNAGILSASDKEYIQHINEDIFNDLPGKPQYAVVTLNSLDGYGSIEDYAEKTFKKLGIGQKSLDNGFLFVISVNDREYRLETGYGVEDVITDSMKEDVVTDEATDLLRNENYGGAVMVISNNIEKLVTNRYGDYEVSKQAIIDERERTARFLTLFAYFIIGIMLLIVMLIVLYKNKLNRLAKRLEKDYISKNMTGYMYQDKTNTLIGYSRPYKKVSLSHFLAKELNKSFSSKDLLSSSSNMKKWLAPYLANDVVIQLWLSNNSQFPYDISIYFDKKHMNQLMPRLVEKSDTFDVPFQSNPYFDNELQELIMSYMQFVTDKHRSALKVSKQNKNHIESVCTKYIQQNGRQAQGRVNSDLQLALMGYYFLKGKDLSNPSLLNDISLTEQNLSKAYRFSEKKRREIDVSQRKKALNDLTNMTLGTYYMQSLIWSSYHSNGSSSSGSGGGSSFGGGSSGGGGFSGGW